MLRLTVGPVLALLLAPVPALAQEGETIVVEGQHLTREEVRAKANDFVRRLGVVQGSRSVARWVEGVCPKVKGLSPDHARIVVNRLRATIEAIGAPLAKENCDTNFLVAFVSDGKEVVSIIDNKAPGRMAQVEGPERRALLESEAPIRWWYMIGIGSGDGAMTGSTPSPVTGGNSEAGASMLPDGVPSGGSFAPSLIRTQAIRMLSAATVIIDVNRAEGVSLNAATNYAAFVGLSEVRGRTLPAVPSILNLFGPQDKAIDLTDWDRRFLTELYALPLNRFGRSQRGHLVKALVDEHGVDNIAD
ncbi:hypothetical protein [Sphingobium sp. WCS2017Hpa-17]|uniref:hypothetical protein n=1 Tax=Sphingobium sp. WCS2017Hpa-17 TaxID=3073638 RepID=UPI00288C5457|nr:hypothetical protein [Sphingobium sp. WCS2017Hpa-17]